MTNLQQNKAKIFKVLVGFPILSDAKFETMFSTINYALDHNHHSMIRGKRGTYTHSARNMLVWDAANEGATHLMFIDSDMVFPANGVDLLLSRKKDIIGGVYHYKGEPYDPVMKEIVTLENGERTMHTPKEIPTDEIFEVDAIGTGFLLINMDVFKNIEPPFFFHADPSEFGLKTLPFPRNDVGEDVYFCLKAKEAGYKIWADPTIELGHVGTKEYTKEDYFSFRSN